MAVDHQQKSPHMQPTEENRTLPPGNWQPSGTASHPPSERADLARGLLRLNATGNHLTPQPQGMPPAPPASDPSQGNTLQSAGMALGHLITRMASHTAVWGSPMLTATSQKLRAEGIPPANNGFFYTDLHTMNIISHALEERVIADVLPADVYSGFQRMALVQPQLPRYRALLDTAQWVYIFGLDDAPAESEAAALHHPHLIRFVIRPELSTALEWFWFVVIDHPTLKTALVAQHVEGDLWSNRQRTRQYSGFWTFDPALVEQVVTILRRGGRALYHGNDVAQPHP